ncbi:MAG: hypothetical protein II453_18915 [Alphaproteobacteria bacterium]|nr:hypothetical protein [Alphaproteobacteria bacterium]
MTVYIWLDDIRDMPWQTTLYADKAIVVRNYKSAVAAVHKYYTPNVNLIVDLDHDLGYDGLDLDHDHSHDPTGYDFCKYLVENEITGQFHIHSMNPSGSENMRQLLNHYGWKEI